MYQTHRASWTVEDAARLLRVHTDTLYDACRRGDFAHERLGGDTGPIRIPCEALRMTYVPDAATARVIEAHRMRSKDFVFSLREPDPLQLELDLGPIKTVRVYRNTGEVIGVWSYERELWGHNKRNNPKNFASGI